MGLTVADSSVLIAVIDATDSCHDIAAEELTRAASRGEILISAVAFSEALVVPYQMGRDTGRAVEAQLAAVGRFVPISAAIGSAAARIRAGRHMRLPDALIIATGVEFNAAEILTFDQRWKDADRRIRVIFRPDP